MSDQVGRECRQPVVLTSSPPIFYRHILADNKSGFFETLTKCNDMVRISVQRPGTEEPDYRHRRLLRARRERPHDCRRRAAEQGDEGAPSHFISLTVLSWDQLSCEPQ